MLRVVSRAAAGIYVCRSSGFSTTARGCGRLDGKIALITGGASGLGRATAHEFLQEGAAAVFLADRNSELGPLAAAELGPKAHFVRCDVTIEEQVADAVDLAVSRHGRLDVLHNSAGIAGYPSPAEISALDLNEFDGVMAVNVRGTLAGIKHAARVMCPAGSGAILCTSSVSGVVGGVGSHPYSISKSAVVAAVRSAAGELGRRGVRINCISPFAVPTAMSMGQFERFYAGGEERIRGIIGGLGELEGAACEPADVAKAAVYLASDEAKYVNGHNLVVDGGFTCFKILNLPMPDR